MGYKDFVEKNGDNIYRKLKPLFQRLSELDEPIFIIIFGGDIKPKNEFGHQLQEMGRTFRKYFLRYPNKAVLLKEIWAKSVRPILIIVIIIVAVLTLRSC